VKVERYKVGQQWKFSYDLPCKQQSGVEESTCLHSIINEFKIDNWLHVGNTGDGIFHVRLCGRKFIVATKPRGATKLLTRKQEKNQKNRNKRRGP
jgi:hypothetical protein